MVKQKSSYLGLFLQVQPLDLQEVEEVVGLEAHGLARHGKDGSEEELESPVIPRHRHHGPPLQLKIVVQSILSSIIRSDYFEPFPLN